MDLSSKQARKILKDYYDWYWYTYYEKKWEKEAHLYGYNYKLTSFHEAVNRSFGFEDPKPVNKKVDHTLDIRRGIEKGVLIAPADRDHDGIIDELMKICKTVDLSDLVNGFLYSLSTGRNEYRTALASYFFAKGIKKHIGIDIRINLSAIITTGIVSQASIQKSNIPPFIADASFAKIYETAKLSIFNQDIGKAKVTVRKYGFEAGFIVI